MRLSLISVALLLSAAGKTGAQTQRGRFDRLAGDPLLTIIDRVPSFAGMWIDSVRIFHGSLTDLNDSSSLRKLMEGYASERGSIRGEDSRLKGIVIDKARYTYAQLFDWKCTIEKAVLGVDGFQSGAASERFNNVRIGVFKPEAVERVRKILNGLGIPLDAVDVRVEGRMFAPGAEDQTLPSLWGHPPNDPIIAIIAQVPSYGGMWAGPGGHLHGSVADPRDSTKLREILTKYVSDPRQSRFQRPEPSYGIVIEKAHYSYAQLTEWAHKIHGVASALTGIGVDEKQNRVEVVVATDAAIKTTNAAIVHLGIPLDAVTIRQATTAPDLGTVIH